MISVIVYGRNDAHGYNLHRRAALSLNCIAHVLTDADDEIVFVDYNTPPEMPVFPEAIRDTLTRDALRRLRVIRVPAELHAARYGSRTHLAALEPVARNVALRRSNPANRWVLATNTDMVLVPASSGSLSEIVAELSDAYWAIPRFQLPEALWERLDRGAPGIALEMIGAWGTRFQLDEPITSYSWMGFDAPGDFQLVPRKWLWTIDGFDESMVLGWHVDTNLARRLMLTYGPPHDLQARVRGYHCDHTRVPGVFHGGKQVSNDVDHFVFDVDHSDLPSQSETWGLAGVELEELDLSTTIASRLPDALNMVVPPPTAPLPAIDARAASGSFAYAASHVIPYVASALSVLPPDAVIGYVGANPDLVALLTRFLAEVGIESPLRVLATGAGFEHPNDATVAAAQVELAREADAIVIDFGLPVERATVAEPTRISDWTPDDRGALDRTLEVFDQLTRLDATAVIGARPLRSYVVVNAVYNVIEGVVDARLTGGGKQFATRVRHGQARSAGNANIITAALPTFDVGDPSHHPEMRYELGGHVDLTQPACAGYLVGEWAWMTSIGTWTDGRRAGFLLDVDPGQLHELEDAMIAVRIDQACDLRRRQSRVVDVEIAGECVDRWRFSAEDVHPPLQRTLVGAALLRRERPIRIDLIVHEPSSPPEAHAIEEPTDRGLLVAGARLGAVDAPLSPGARIEAAGMQVAPTVLWTGWSWPEDDGTWTVGPHAVLRIPPVRADTDSVDLLVEFADVFVRPGQDPFELEAVVDDGPRERWSFDRAGPHERHVTLKVSDTPTTINLHLPAMVSGRSLGESADPRRLGVKVAAVAVPSRAEAPSNSRRTRGAFRRRAREETPDR